MHKIEAYIRNSRLAAVQDALEDLGISGLTVAEVRGRGRQTGETYTYRGSSYTLDLAPRLKLELVADDADVDAIVASIVKSAATGEIGDGKVVVSPVSRVVRIRTGEEGAAAL